MTRAEIEAGLDYWGAEIERSKNYIYECEDNLTELYEQLDALRDEE